MHPYNSDPCDDQNACTMNDICSDGECTGTSIDCTDDDPCTINEGCDPEIGCVADPYCEDDGGPCTIDECDPQTGDCTYEPMWGPWDTCAPDDCLIGLSVPPQLFVNNDDDNGNGILDLKEPGPIIGEDDLQMVTVDASGCPEPCGLGWALGEGGHPHQCFFGSNKTDPIEWPSFPQDWPVPGVLWMEGTAATDSCGVPTLFIGDKGDGSGKKCCEVRSTPIQVVAVDSLEWREAAAYPDNPELGNCPNNGGKRIFPGKISPDDSSPGDRRKVDLVDRIEPPIAGLTVYFKVWDVDDSFDQNNPAMPNVG